MAFQIGDVPAVYEGQSDPFASTFLFELGECSISEDTARWQVRFDNVVFDAK